MGERKQRQLSASDNVLCIWRHVGIVARMLTELVQRTDETRDVCVCVCVCVCVVEQFGVKNNSWNAQFGAQC